MHRRPSPHPNALLAVGLVLTFAAAPLRGQTNPESDMTGPIATGTFDVDLTPLPATAPLARMRLEKRFHGDIEGTSEGEMLSWQDEGTGAAAYVAIERVTGSLHGRTGSFVLTHRGTMRSDEQRLTVEVVPGSGTGNLTGLAGTLAIEISDGEHAYELEYRLPGAEK